MRQRVVLGWLGLAVALIASLGLAFGAYTLANESWSGVVDYKSPYVSLPLPAVAHGSELASMTVLVIVDGLSESGSRRMEGLNRLRQYGMDITLTAPQPSLSYPNWTTILSGAPPYVSGVTTNWHEGAVGVDTLLESARRAGAKTVVVAPDDFKTLYNAGAATASFFKTYPYDKYAATELVDQTLRLVSEVGPRLVVLQLPDVDNAGHRSGGDSEDYRSISARVDSDLARLVGRLQGAGVVFVVVGDHGHIDTGGHGGWERDVVEVPGVFFGAGVPLGQAEARQEDVASTVAVLAGIPVPEHSKGDTLDEVVGDAGEDRLVPAWNQRVAFANAYAKLVTEPTDNPSVAISGAFSHGAKATRLMQDADAERLAFDRGRRLWIGLAGLAAALAILAVVAVASWRMLVAATAGTVAYYAVYNMLFFVVHGYAWSLSAFNEETKVKAFMNGRMIEAVVSAGVAAVVASVVYVRLRRRSGAAERVPLSTALTLGPVTALAVLATIGVQVAWFVWGWGVGWTWNLPDLKWGFKTDLDLIQATAVGVSALVLCVVTLVVMRYGPSSRSRGRHAAGRTSGR